MATDDDPPECVIASSNRFNDLAPYCTSLWRAHPQIWSDILPWDFPQNAPKDVEEAFLRKYFSEREIYMQGGAHGQSNGFKFLKQVWYCIALDNHERRVPAVADWWRERDEQQDQLLKDEKMIQWFCRNTAKPSALFSPEECAMFGENFLQWVVRYLQVQVKRSMEPPSAEQQGEQAGDQQNQVDHLSPDAKLAQTVSEPTSKSTPEVSGHSPFPPFTESPRTTRSDVGYATNREERLPRKRGYSGGSIKRKNNFGNLRSKDRQPATFHERNMAHQSPQPWSANPQDKIPPSKPPVHVQERMSSGQRSPFAMQHPQAHHMQGFPPGYYSHQGRSQHSLPFPPLAQTVPAPPGFDQSAYPQPPPGQPYRHQGFPPGQFYDNSQDYRNFSNDSQFSGPDNYGKKGGRRNTIRGNKTRQFSDGGRGRGRGSRDGNNFDLYEPNSFGPAVPTSEFAGPQTNMRMHSHRRGSVHNNNWRSGSDRPQQQQQQNENNAPGRMFSEPNQQPPRPMERKMFDRQVSGGSAPLPRFPQCPDMANDQAMYPDTTVTRNQIGAHVRHVKKLILFGIRTGLNEQALADFFSRFDPSVSVIRMQPNAWNAKPPYQKSTMPPPCMIAFEHPEAARAALSLHNTQLPSGDWLNLEVAKEYWDPQHHNYQPNLMRAAYGGQSNRVQPDLPTNQAPKVTFAIMQRGSAMAPQHNIGDIRSNDSTPTAQRVKGNVKEIVSGDTTPTPSGASTPKQGKGNKSAKKKREAAFREHEAQLTAQANDKATGTLNVAEAEPIVKHEAVTKDSGEGEDHEVDANKASSSDADIDKELSVKEGPAGVGAVDDDTHAQAASSIPTMSEPDLVGTEQSEISSAQQLEEAQTKPEPTFSPAMELTAKMPPFIAKPLANVLQPIREEKTAEETTASTQPALMNVSTEYIRSPKSPRLLENSEAEMLDDSFHTASGSPDNCSQAASRVRTLDMPEGDQETKSTADHSASSSDDDCATPSASEDAGPSPSDGAVPPAADALLSHPSEPLDHAQQDKQVKKTPVPHLVIHPPPTRPTAVAFAPETENQQADEDAEASPRRQTSGQSVPPTPAFVTAPNTPAVSSESPKPGAPSTKPATPPKKPEKPKGPAVTASLSLFGRKNESKQKKSTKAKGSLKGKPKLSMPSTSDVANDGAGSRAVSGTTTPNSHADDTPAVAESSVTPAVDAPQQSPREATFATKPAKLSPTSEQIDNPTELTPACPTSPQQRRSILPSFFGSFRGTTSQNLPPFQESDLADSESVNDPLTRIEDAQTHKTETHVEAAVLADNKIIAPVAVMASSARVNSSATVSDNIASNDGGGSDVASACVALDQAEMEPVKAKKKKTRKRKKTTTSTEEAADNSMELSIHLSKQDSGFITPEPQTARTHISSPFTFEHPHKPERRSSDVVSEATSRTLGGELTPESPHNTFDDEALAAPMSAIALNTMTDASSTDGTPDSTAAAPTKGLSPMAKKILGMKMTGPSHILVASTVRKASHRRVMSAKAAEQAAAVSESSGTSTEGASPVRITDLSNNGRGAPVFYLFVKDSDKEEAQAEVIAKTKKLLEIDSAARDEVEEVEPAE